MKIILFNTLYYPFRVGGAEVSVQVLAEELLALGHNVRVISLHDKHVREEVEVNGVSVVYLPISNIYWPFGSEKQSSFKKIAWHLIDTFNPFMYYKVIEELEIFKPDVVHTNNLAGFSVSAWSAVKKLKIKLIHTSRDYYLFHPNCTMFSKDKNMRPNALSIKFWSYVKRKMSTKVDVYVGISNYISKLHTDNGFFSKSRHAMIYNSVKKIQYLNENRDFKTIGFIGRLSVEKGYDIFCDFAKDNKGNKKYHFVAAGNFVNNHDKSNLEKKTIDGNIELLGYIPLDKFMSKVDIAFLPIKWHEPFGRTVVECALSNKVVITNSVGAMTELSTMMDNILIFDKSSNLLNLIDDFDYESGDEEKAHLFNPTMIAKNYLESYKL